MRRIEKRNRFQPNKPGPCATSANQNDQRGSLRESELYSRRSSNFESRPSTQLPDRSLCDTANFTRQAPLTIVPKLSTKDGATVTPVVSNCNEMTTESPDFRGFDEDNTVVRKAAVSEKVDELPVSVISVLNSLSTFVYLLGVLRPKLTEMFMEALEMEKINVNRSDHLLENENYSILFDVIKEKMKGILRANLVEEQDKRMAIEQIIKDMDALLVKFGGAAKSAQSCDTQIGANKTLFLEQPKPVHPERIVQAPMSDSMELFGVDETVSQTPTQNISPRVTIENSPTTFDPNLCEQTALSDADLTTLMKKFDRLTDYEQRNVILVLREILFNDAQRLKRLRNDKSNDKFIISKLLLVPPMPREDIVLLSD